MIGFVANFIIAAATNTLDGQPMQSLIHTAGDTTLSNGLLRFPLSRLSCFSLLSAIATRVLVSTCGLIHLITTLIAPSRFYYKSERQEQV